VPPALSIRAPQALFGRKRDAGAPRTVLELMVLEGADAGQQFTVDGAEVRIGRGKPKTGQTGTILLHDKSVSGLQATIRAGRGGSTIEHNPGATNPTLVNGRRIKKQKIEPGDQIQMGLIKIEVRQRQGIALSGLFHVEEDGGTEPLDATAVHEGPTGAHSSGDKITAEMGAVQDADLEATTLVDSRGELILVRGVPDMENRSFPIGLRGTVVGRSASCDVTIPEPGISRQHARFEWQEGELLLSHLSETNSTCVNGQLVDGTRILRDGDDLLLADQVVLRVQLSKAGLGGEDRPTLPPAGASSQAVDPDSVTSGALRSLRHAMEDKIERDRLIEEQFAVVGSFVDIDVVGSYKMKAEADRPAHIVVSFERFRTFVGDCIQEFGGQVLNSNGDELMCFFESTLDAVRSASAILARLDDFNENQNVLGSPFRFRIGVHTGRSLVDRERGVAYSEVLDIAGHLQKAADVNGLCISGATLEALPEGLPFEDAGTLEHERIPMYKATAEIP
jgi:class 3 adenylate cyclase